MKKVKRLILQKETVRRLGDTDLARVAAGTQPSDALDCPSTPYQRLKQHVDNPGQAPMKD
jgi:hypothetical protein